MSRAGSWRRKASIWAREPVFTPERKLWRAVLTQAHEDAELAAPEGVDDSEPLEQLYARSYLRADTPQEAENLKLVCEFADLPADRIYLWARRRYPLQQTPAKDVECGSPAAALTTAPLEQSKEGEPGSRTPQIAA